MFDLSNLNENQRKAAEFNEGPCLVIAAAGTGKTTVLIHRVANLVFNGVNERSILLLTFTNKAANEMKERACKILEKDTLELTACTYHSFCVQYLRKYAALLGLNSSFTIIDGTDAGDVMKILKEEKGYNEEAKFPTHKALVNIFSTSINKELSIDKVVEILYPEYVKYLDDIKLIKESYIQYKLDKNILDYDDILTLFLSLIKNNDNICKKISDTFEYIMVDEYQDSNGIQSKILKELRKYENKNLMVVGDDQQCLPKGTKILTENGFKNIEDISLKDSLIVAGGRGVTCKINPESISRKKYSGDLISIKTKSGKKLSATPNHIIFADYKIKNKYFVYLMYSSKLGFRIGKSSYLKSNERNGYESRMINEGAERVWLLKVCDSDREAHFYEQYYAVKYGLPLYVFYTKGRKCILTQDDVNNLFASIDTFSRGRKLLQDLNMFFEYPHYMNQIRSTENGRNFRRLNFCMFGSNRRHKMGDFKGFKHELSYNTIDEEFDAIGNKYMGNTSSKKKNIYGCHYNNGRKVLGDQDVLLDISEKILGELPDIYLKKMAHLTDNKKYEFSPFSNLRVGMKICYYLNNEIIEDEIISVERSYYDGYVYDINVPLYRNYIAENIVVHNCLYGFRGSKFDNIMHFPDEFEKTEVIVLDENYRSNQEILDVANVVINKAKEKYEKSLKGTHKAGRKPILMECYNTEEESKYILNEIEKLLCPPYNYEMKDIAVLIRNSKDSYMLESLLTRNYYSYEKYGGIKFLEKSFIKDIFSFLKVSVNDKDELAWFRLLQLYPNIGIVYAKKLTESILKNGVEELLDDKYNGRKYAEYFEDIYEKTTYLKGLDIKEQLDYLIDTYYFELQKTKIETSKMSKNKKTELLSEIKDNKEEAQVLKEFALGYTSTLKFLTDLTLETPEKSSSKDKITISTVHSAKGLEWKAVFIVNCINGSFPSPSRITPKGAESVKWIEEEEEEERRIFYVAVTRAKNYLYLTYPKVKFGYDKMPERTELSDFIDKDLKKTLDYQIKERETWYW